MQTIDGEQHIKELFEKLTPFQGLDMSSKGGKGYTSKRTNTAYRAFRIGFLEGYSAWGVVIEKGNYNAV